jgi:hypothetical protein
MPSAFFLPLVPSAVTFNREGTDYVQGSTVYGLGTSCSVFPHQGSSKLLMMQGRGEYRANPLAIAADAEGLFCHLLFLFKTEEGQRRASKHRLCEIANVGVLLARSSGRM